MMKDIQMRKYKGTRDFEAMLTFTSETWTPQSQFHIGDLAWGRFQHIRPESDWPTAIWERNGKILGWGWIELPSFLNFTFNPQFPEVGDSILDWFEETAKNHELFTMILDSETHLSRALLRKGYHLMGDQPFFTHMSHDLNLLSEPILPEGFMARSIRGKADLKNRALAHQRAWHPSKVSEESYHQVMRTSPYRQSLDWVIESPAGDFVSYCLLWFDEKNKTGLIEPIGTHPDFRGKGLARAVCLSALQELKKQGATMAIVKPRGDDAYPIPAKFYRSLGFKPFAQTESFEKRIT